MTAIASESTVETRVSRLRAYTRPLHVRLDQSIARARFFEDRRSYGLFLQVQHSFFLRVEEFYRTPTLNVWISGLSKRSRLRLVDQDLKDLNLVADLSPKRAGSLSHSKALGWLYVAEGSNLGAAFLVKQAQELGLSSRFGARHLAWHPEGRASNWREFIVEFDAIPLSDSEERETEQAAADAFQFVQDHTAMYSMPEKHESAYRLGL